LHYKSNYGEAYRGTSRLKASRDREHFVRPLTNLHTVASPPMIKGNPPTEQLRRFYLSSNVTFSYKEGAPVALQWRHGPSIE